MDEQWAKSLACRVAAGDREAFDELMRHFYPGLLRAAYLIAGNRADSEDIVQETLLPAGSTDADPGSGAYREMALSNHDQRSMAGGKKE